MINLANTPYSSTSALLNSTLDTLGHYGFEDIQSGLDKPKVKDKLHKTRELAYVLPHERKLAGLTKTYLEGRANKWNTPKLLYNIDKPRAGSKSSSFGLHVVGAEGAVAEITILSTVATLLKKFSMQDFVVHINSIGDRESKIRFVRELNNYMRDISSELPSTVLQDFKRKESLLALSRLLEQGHTLAYTAPDPVEYLSDDSRARLREVLEYMEHMNINYELDKTLLGSVDCWDNTIFEFRIPKEDAYVPVARGGRYSTLARRVYGKKLSSVGVIIDHDLSGRTAFGQVKNINPKFFISWLGDEARASAFSVMENFHDSGIPLAKLISSSCIAEQMKYSEKLDVPYIIIIGYKESMDNTAIVRNTATRVQKAVPMSQLVSYVSRLKV